MDTLKQNVLVIAVSVVLAVAGAWFLGVGGTNTETVTREVVKEIQKGESNLGALSSPDISSPYLGWGGVRSFKYRAALNTATNTPCAFLSPAGTSTLVSSQLIVTTGSTTATIWRTARHTTAFATSTASINTFSLASGLQGAFNTVATSTAVDANTTFPPNTYLVWSLEGTAHSDTTKLNGYCQAEFIPFVNL